MIKIYGERNTNTNYLEKLIELNLEVSQLRGVVPMGIAKLQKQYSHKEFIKDLYFFATIKKNFGWKHQKLPKEFPNQDIKFITITKNPYAWLLSLYKKPYHQKYKVFPKTFEEFLLTPWKTLGRDKINQKVLASPVELWNIKNRSYMEFHSKYLIHLKSEDIFDNPRKIIENISTQFNIATKKSFFQNYIKSTKGASLVYEDYREYYLQEHWKESLSLSAINIINDKIDMTLMEYYDYDLLSGSEKCYEN